MYAEADFPLQAATMFGVSESPDRISQQVNFQCQTSECRYPTFKSLAICSRCANIDSHLEKNTASTGDQFYSYARGNPAAMVEYNQTQYQLPNGLFINNVRDHPLEHFVYMTMAGTSHPEKTIAMQDVDALIWSQSVVKVEPPKEGQLWPDIPVHATECALYYCVKEYTSEVKNGTLIETSAECTDEKRNPKSWELRSKILNNTGDNGLSDSFVKSLAFDDTQSALRRTDLQLGSKYNVSKAAVDSISGFVQSSFGPCLNSSGICDFEEDPINGYYIASGSLEEGQQEYEPAAAKVFWETDDLAYVFDNVARSMSNAIRNGADEGGSAVIPGEVGVTIAVYDVDWRWISLHVSIELGVMLFLALTMWASASRFRLPIPVWKSSSLAVLFSGANAREGLNASTKTELEDVARTMFSTLAGVRTRGEMAPALDTRTSPVTDGGGNYRQVHDSN